jgi:hypothetical protein
LQQRSAESRGREFECCDLNAEAAICGLLPSATNGRRCARFRLLLERVYTSAHVVEPRFIVVSVTQQRLPSFSGAKSSDRLSESSAKPDGCCAVVSSGVGGGIGAAPLRPRRAPQRWVCCSRALNAARAGKGSLRGAPGTHTQERCGRTAGEATQHVFDAICRSCAHGAGGTWAKSIQIAGFAAPVGCVGVGLRRSTRSPGNQFQAMTSGLPFPQGHANGEAADDDFFEETGTDSVTGVWFRFSCRSKPVGVSVVARGALQRTKKSRRAKNRKEKGQRNGCIALRSRPRPEGRQRGRAGRLAVSNEISAWLPLDWG